MTFGDYQTAADRVLQIWVEEGGSIPADQRLVYLAKVSELGLQRYTESEIRRASRVAHGLARNTLEVLATELHRDHVLNQPHHIESESVCGACGIAIDAQGLCKCSGRPETGYGWHV